MCKVSLVKGNNLYDPVKDQTPDPQLYQPKPILLNQHLIHKATETNPTIFFRLSETLPYTYTVLVYPL